VTLRPPLDHLMSTQRMRITRWSPHVRDRHAGRSRSTAGVLAGLRPMPEGVQWLVTSVLGAPVGGI
jgi:hypothetical protein